MTAAFLVSLPIVRVLYEGETDKRMGALRRWLEQSDWLETFEELAKSEGNAHRITDHFPVVASFLFRWAAHVVVIELRCIQFGTSAGVWRLVPLLMIVLSVLVPLWFWLIGEEVYSLRSDAYYMLSIVRSGVLVLSAHSTPAACRRLFRDFGATLPVAAIAYVFPACFDRFAYLYDSYWFTAMVTGATCVLVYLAQYHLPLMRFMFSGRAKNRFTDDALMMHWIGLLTAFLSKLCELDRDSDCGVVYNLTMSAIKEAVETLVLILKAALSNYASLSDVVAVPTATPAVSKTQTACKIVYTLCYFITGGTTFFLVLLRKQWGSVSQTAFAMFAVGIMLVMMSFSNGYSLNAYMDYFMPLFTFMFGSLFGVIIPQVIIPDLYDGYSVVFWSVYGGMFLFTFLLSGLLVNSVRIFWRSNNQIST